MKDAHQSMPNWKKIIPIALILPLCCLLLSFYEGGKDTGFVVKVHPAKSDESQKALWLEYQDDPNAKIDTSYIQLEITFINQRESTDTIYFARRTLTPFFRHRNEKSINLDTLKSISLRTIGHLAHSQLIIENIKGQFRFFYEGKKKAGHLYIHRHVPMFFTKGPIFERCVLKKGEKCTISSGTILEEALRISEADAVLRFHYIFIPENMAGKAPRLFTSDWFSM